jgi:hypothetical protein
MAVLGSDNISHSTTFKFNINSADRVTIDDSGRLLVGTSSAIETSLVSTIIQVATSGGGSLVLGRNQTTSPSVGSNLGSLFFYSNSGSVYEQVASISALVASTHSAGNKPSNLVFSTTAAGESSPTERMRIPSNGGLLVGLTSGLDISTGTADGIDIKTFVGGIAVSNNQQSCLRLRRRTNNGPIVVFRRDTTEVGSISVTTTATAYNTSSDYRLKENVVDLDGAIDRIKLLPVHRFNFIADPDTVVDGFLAHEAQEIVPECVTGTKDEMKTAKDVVLSSDGKILSENIKMEDWESGKIPNEDDESTYPVDSTWTEEYEVPVYQGIDQSKIVPLLTAALQEAIAKIETLEQRLAAAGIN